MLTSMQFCSFWFLHIIAVMLSWLCTSITVQTTLWTISTGTPMKSTTKLCLCKQPDVHCATTSKKMKACFSALKYTNALVAKQVAVLKCQQLLRMHFYHYGNCSQGCPPLCSIILQCDWLYLETRWFLQDQINYIYFAIHLKDHDYLSRNLI